MEVCYLVAHRGLPQLVGKNLLVRGKLICVHEKTGDQQHQKLGGPGVDARHVEAMIKDGVAEFHLLDKPTGHLLVTTPQTIKEHGIRADYDERDRYYLPLSYWQERELDYDASTWVTAEVELTDRGRVLRRKGQAPVRVPDAPDARQAAWNHLNQRLADYHRSGGLSDSVEVRQQTLALWTASVVADTHGYSWKEREKWTYGFRLPDGSLKERGSQFTVDEMRRLEIYADWLEFRPVVERLFDEQDSEEDRPTEERAVDHPAETWDTVL